MPKRSGFWIGVEVNTLVIIKCLFWQMTNDNSNTVYVCIDYGQMVFALEKLATRESALMGDKQ